jgi:7-carboxy-7-deazaguanine synthase
MASVTTLRLATLVVSETFGPTLQGGGPSAGRRAGFIRLMGCNLHCGKCDTAYTWDASRFDLLAEGTRRPVTEIAAAALEGNPGIVVVTGGEPLLHQHQPGWAQLLALLTAGGAEIEIETNGTVAPTTETTTAVTRFNVSPKLSGALSDGADPEQLRINAGSLTALRDSGKAAFKFVCSQVTDIAEAAGLCAGLGIPKSMVWIMPEGTAPDVIAARLRELADPAIAAGFNVTTRLHVLAWGDERGR